ncbi:MAG TPA: HAD-IB family phosphatase [Ferruginibacter sp.]|nr:HAD-IB family phosphatase [Ferruginibacter sp.]HRE62435.1 HAD-IB family phosphatase [Ferruginibacter sp.]
MDSCKIQKEMVTVIIPTLNEQETINYIINYAYAHPQVNEVLVIDDKSVDDTVAIARAAGASVYSSARLGKGASMREGILLAKNEYIVFMDGDIDPYPPKMLELLINPLLEGDCDFVKSCFSRNAGRVTELVAKPLLSIFFPELVEFNQPLSGMIAGKKSILETLQIPNDYGVDISILIDLFSKGNKIQQVNIGHIENKSRPLNQIGKMSKEVSATILKKAIEHKRSLNLDELSDFDTIAEQLQYSVKDSIGHLKKMLILDMDDTILQGRFINVAAEKFCFTKELLTLRRDFEGDTITLTKSIARLLKGKTIKEIIDVAESIPPIPDIVSVVKKLKERGYIIGVISDSYTVITEHIKNTIGADFSLSNELGFSHGICSGEVQLPSFFFKNDKSICTHNLCKTNAMLSIAKEYNIDLKNIIAVGDSRNDLCMILKSGLGISFCSKDEMLKEFADISIEQPSFEMLLEID